MGKWDEVTARLPRILGTDAKYQEKVNAVKDELVERDGDAARRSPVLALRYRELRDRKDEVQARLDALNLELTAVQQLMIDAFERDGLKSIHLEDGASVSVQVEPQAQVVDRDAFRAWCVANGLERSLQLPWMTANSLLKERLQNGEPEMDGVQAYALAKVVARGR